MVRLLQLRIRRHEELRLCNIATVLGERARGWRELLTQSVLPGAVLPSVSPRLSLLILIDTFGSEERQHGTALFVLFLSGTNECSPFFGVSGVAKSLPVAHGV